MAFVDDPETLVSTKWLETHLHDNNIRVLDASWYLPAMERDARAEYDVGHIPEARFFDIDDISDHRSDLPHMMPPVEKFLSRIRQLGVGDGHQIVVYDGMGLFSAPRVWWMFRYMGHKQVAVLNGGLPKWKREGRLMSTEPPTIRDRHMFADVQHHLIRDVTEVASAVKLHNEQIVDARPADRFSGATPEPREGLRSGHIPGSKNVCFQDLIRAGLLRSDDELRAIFEKAGVDIDQPIVTTCGSGVTAAVLALALARLGRRDTAVYDGSWAEWGAFSHLAIEPAPET